MIRFGLSSSIISILEPREPTRTVDWAAREINLPIGSELKGKFRPDLFPHSIEPLDCFDDPFYRTISLQWGARLGKTVLGQTVIAKTAKFNPSPMAWADADERSVQRVLRRTWKVLEKVPGLEVPPRRLQSGDKIALENCLVHGAWSGSPSAAADYAALVIVKNEIDKFSRNKSDEADFSQLMDERAKGFVHFKILNMSTPGYLGRSRINTYLLGGDRRQRYCPCPFCNHFQTLVMGDGKKPGGIRWKRLSSGQHDKQMAEETAFYECEKCRKPITNQYRYRLLNDGLWIKEGQRVTPSGKVMGKPVKEGPDASFGPLSTLYSLLPSVNWGMIAAKFISANQCPPQERKEALRNFTNSWLAITWDDKPTKLDPSEILERIIGQHSARVVPEWAIFATVGIDVQSGGDEFYWWVQAWGIDGRSAKIESGHTMNWPTMREILMNLSYPHADGGPSVKPMMMLIDSGDGNVTDTVYSYCRSVPGLMPCKGSSNSRFPGIYRESIPDNDPTKKEHRVPLGSLTLFEINTHRTQEWIQNVLDGTTQPGQPYHWALPFEDALDIGLVDQLQNEYPGDEENDQGYTVRKWFARGPQHLRDAARYARAAASYLTRGDAIWQKLPPRIKTQPTSVPQAVTSSNLPSHHLPGANPAGWVAAQR
jgi:phage terminase large subunit GpA-like protein